MLLPRIIPCLLIKDGGLIKTVKFKESKYVGDPINAVSIFNKKEVDELIVLDIKSSLLKKEPDYNLIASIARESRMPICYGGGVKKPEEVEKLVSIGIEKVAISSEAISNPNIISEVASRVGSQSIVIVLDLKRTGFLKNKYKIYTLNGSKKSDYSLEEFIDIAQEKGAGELVFNSIDRDGTMKGYDFEILDLIKNRLSIPCSILGGAENYKDFSRVYKKHGIVGCAAGSIFVFKGKYRAVLLQYPNLKEKNEIFSSLE